MTIAEPVKKQSRILDAALEVFSAHGFKGATLDEITEQAAMSKPDVLCYFKSRDDIYQAVLQHTLDAWLEPLTELDPAGDPLQEIESYIRRKVELSRTTPKSSRLFAGEILQGAPCIADILRGPLKTLVDEKAVLIQHWIDEGRLAAVDPYHLIFAIWATTQHYAEFSVQVRAVMGGQVEEKVHFARAVLGVLLEGVRVGRNLGQVTNPT